MATYYAWSDFYLGGESIEGKDHRKIITKRDIVPQGEKVTAKKLGVTNEVFEDYVSRGLVRDYPLPEGMSDDYVGSPVEFVREEIARKAEEAEDAANVQNDVLLRSFSTGALLAPPIALLDEPPLLEGVEEA